MDLNDFRLAELHFEMATQVDPEFANAYFNLALVRAINDNSVRAIDALAKYQNLVSAEEARAAAELIGSVKASLSVVKAHSNGRPSSSSPK